jgi:hypothetical protein
VAAGAANVRNARSVAPNNVGRHMAVIA